MNPLLSKLQPYPFERLRQLFAGVTPSPYHSPISLGIGEPKHPTPEFIKSALVNNLEGLAGYPATAGEPRLREAIQLPETHAIETVIAVGKPGRPDRLPEALRARETPNGRLPLADVAFEGRFKSNS